MNKNLSPKQVLILFAFVLTFLIIVGTMAYNRLVSLVESNENINRNNDFVLKLEEIISYLKDAETGSRGYLLTSDTTFLRPQRMAGRNVMNHILTLRKDIKNINEQIPYLDSIQELSQKKIDNIWLLVHSMKAGQLKPLTENQQKLIVDGKILMEHVRFTVQNLKNLEQARLDRNIVNQTEFAAESPHYLRILIILAILVIILTMLGMYQQLLLLNKAKKNLEEKVGELAQANRELDQYAFTLSHHLQEPLRKIRMFSSRFENKFKKAADTEGGIESIKKINALAADSQYLLDEFLAFANLSQKNKNEIESIDLPKMIEHIWDKKKDLIKQTQAEYTFEGDTEIKGFKNHIALLFEQLMDNALKFRHLDRHPIVHFVSGWEMIEEQPFYVLTVSDNGIGFEQEYAQKVFSIFQKLNPKNDNSGLGVGLAICRKIVELHNGTITAESHPDLGSTFTIKMPIKKRMGNTLEIFS